MDKLHKSQPALVQVMAWNLIVSNYAAYSEFELQYLVGMRIKQIFNGFKRVIAIEKICD